MKELEERKFYQDGKLVELEVNQSVIKVTEEDIRCF